MAGKKTAPPRGLEQMTAEELAERPWALTFWLSKSCKVFRELAGVEAGRDRKDLYAREAAACGKVVAAIAHARTLAKKAPWLGDLVKGVGTGADAYAGLFAKLMADPELEALGVEGDGGGAGGDGWRAKCTRAAGVCDALERAVGVETAELGWVPRKAPAGLSLRDVLQRAGDVVAACDAACGGARVSSHTKELAERTADNLFGLMCPWLFEERPLCDGGVATRLSRRPRTEAEQARLAMMDGLRGLLLSVAGGKVAPDTGKAIQSLLARLAADADKDAIAAGVPRPEHAQAVPTAKERPEPGLQELEHTLSDQERQAYDFIKSKFPEPVPCKKLANALEVEVSAITNRIARNLKRLGLIRTVRAGGYTLTTNP